MKKSCGCNNVSICIHSGKGAKISRFFFFFWPIFDPSMACISPYNINK
ncbi:unnamed protein product, partial [Staurois parvus]